MSDVLTPEERGAIARVNRDLGHAQNLSRTSVAWRRRLLAIIDRLVAEVERLRLLRVAAVNHLLRPDIGFREKRSHTPACRPGSGGNENYCSTCALQKALEESHT